MPVMPQRPYHFFGDPARQDDSFRPANAVWSVFFSMRVRLDAKMAAFVLLVFVAAAGFSNAAHAGALKEPVKIRFQLADGVRVGGEMTAWDRDGFEGSFGRREWIDLAPDDVSTIRQRVMDLASIGDWVDLGRSLLLMDHDRKKAGELAEKAFSRARRIDSEQAEALIRQVREEISKLDRAKRESARAAEAAKLSTTSPEGQDWPADPWPPLTSDQQKAATLTMRTEAQHLLEQAGLRFTAVETDHVLLFSDVPRGEASRLAFLLERTYGLVRSLLDRGKTDPQQAVANLFWGKAVVFVFADQDRFRLVEADAFRHLVPRGAVAVCHPDGPKVFINARREPDESRFHWALAREFVHGVMHRHRTPRRLPPWANEGFADAVCDQLLRDSPFGKERRKRGVAWFRQLDAAGLAPAPAAPSEPASPSPRGVTSTSPAATPPPSLLDRSYEDAAWSNPDDPMAAAGMVLVQLMMQDQPQAFIDWLNDVKQGREWTESLAQTFHVSRARLMETAAQYYRVND